MAWSYESENYENGDHLTPHEYNTDIQRAVAEMNGKLDRENIGQNDITGDKLEYGSINLVHFVVEKTDAPIYHVGTSTGLTWTQVGNLSRTIETIDCSLDIDFNVGWFYKAIAGSGTGYVSIAIMVDDEVVAETDGEYHQPSRVVVGGNELYNCDHVTALVPVSAGQHTIKAVARIWRAAVLYSNEMSITCQGRILFVRQVRR